MAASSRGPNITFVTALCKIYPDRNTDARLQKDIVALLRSGMKLIVYVDESFLPFLESLGPLDSTVKIIPWTLDRMNIWSSIIGARERLALPQYRTAQKDTLEYMALMNTKVEFLKLAQAHADTEYIAWVDAGIAKMLDPTVDFARLKNSELFGIETVLIPGCYQRKFNFDELCSGVKWVYAGSFLVAHRSFVDTFYEQSQAALKVYMDANRMAWEVNVWCTLDQMYPGTFVWYAADHDCTITKFPGMYCRMY